MCNDNIKMTTSEIATLWKATQSGELQHHLNCNTPDLRSELYFTRRGELVAIGWHLNIFGCNAIGWHLIAILGGGVWCEPPLAKEYICIFYVYILCVDVLYHIYRYIHIYCVYIYIVHLCTSLAPQPGKILCYILYTHAVWCPQINTSISPQFCQHPATTSVLYTLYPQPSL